MPDYHMLNWMQDNEVLVWWLVAGSAVTFVATLLLVPLILIRLPEDYFSHRQRIQLPASIRHPLVHAVVVLIKNGLGLLFVLAGIAMLVLPGQGILTMVVGLLLLDFPGKYRAVQWAVHQPAVSRTINWIRARANKSPLKIGSDR